MLPSVEAQAMECLILMQMGQKPELGKAGHEESRLGWRPEVGVRLGLLGEQVGGDRAEGVKS